MTRGAEKLPFEHAGQRTPEHAMPPFAPLRAFEALVRFGGFRKAANSLEVHHSVVSRHVKHLEAWLGVPLLRWSGKSFALTEAGERYYSRIATAMAEMALATNEVLGNEASRPIALWCSHGLSIQWLASQIHEFEKLNPGIRVELRPSDEPADLNLHEAHCNIFMYLDEQLADAAGRGLKGQLLARPLAMIATSPELAAELDWIQSANDLLNAPLLHGKHCNDWRWWLTINGVTVPSSLPGQLCWHPLMSLEAARLGRGVLLANRFFLEQDLARGSLVELKVPGTTHSAFGGYMFIAREDRWTMPGLAALRHFLIVRMKTMERQM